MKIKNIVQLCAALILIKTLSALDQKPNIVFVFSDDHAPHAIGAYDGWLKSVNPTPVIDRLRIRRHAFCQQLLYEFNLRA